MKPTDIQIGDLLTFEECLNDEAYPIIKVTGILQDSFFARIDDAKGEDELDYEGVVGIPLTAEILEKNGWKRAHDIYVVLALDEAQYLEWYEYEGRFRRYYKHKDGRESMAFTVSGLSYIHELQRALRCCGLYEEANNITV